jgi:hypothetical protein
VSCWQWSRGPRAHHGEVGHVVVAARPDGGDKEAAAKLEANGKPVDLKELLRMEPNCGTTNIRNVKSKHWARWRGAPCHHATFQLAQRLCSQSISGDSNARRVPAQRAHGCDLLRQGRSWGKSTISRAPTRSSSQSKAHLTASIITLSRCPGSIMSISMRT